MTDGLARRRVRSRRDVVAAAVAGVLVGAGLYPLTVLVHPLLACPERGGLETVGPCLFQGFASLALAFLLLSLTGVVVLRLRKVPCALAVAGLSLLTIVALVWRVLFLLADLGQVLGAAFPWIGVAVFPAVYVAWLLLLTAGADGDRGVGVVAGMVILVLVFAVPGTAQGADRRHSEAGQLRWLASLPFTVYEPAALPPGYWLYAVEGQYSSRAQLRLLYRNQPGPSPGPSKVELYERISHQQPPVTITQSPPYPEFAPPEGCGNGDPGDGAPRHPCAPIATMPSGEPIFSWSPSSSGERLYGVRLGDTVITAKGGVSRLEGAPPDPVMVGLLQQLRPVDPVDLGRRHFEARRDRAAAERAPAAALP